MRLIFGASVLTLLGLSVANAAFAEPGWSVTQAAKGGTALTGQMTIYITSNGMRTYDPKNGVTLMTRGPNWTVYIYNTKTKKIYQSALQPWLASFKQRGISGRFDGASWKRGNSNIAVAGQRAYEFVMDRPPQVKTNSKSLSGKVKKYGSSIQGGSLWVASDIATPPQVSNIISQLYGIPDSQRIPLRMVAIENGRPSTMMDTTKVARIDVPASIFAVPGGLQPVKQDADVFIDQESMDTLDEMLQELDTPAPKRPAPGTRPAAPRR